MKKLPIGIQNIREILEEGQLYVDKTKFALNLIEDGKHYFMSRPRRFGKSLFINTLEEIFKGNKELFRGLEIYQSDYDWKKHPVIRLDFAQIESGTPEKFEIDIKEKLKEIASTHKISIEGPSIKTQLRKLIPELAKNNRVVTLVDEYDHPIINHLNDPKIADKNRDILKSFFETLKSLDDHLKFTFITGVSKFSHGSIFSGLNNLKDITFDLRYSGMMGYTQEELKTYFSEHIESIIQSRKEQGNPTTKNDILDEIRTWYNGYRFSRSEICVYNPFSTLNYMDEKEVKTYWYSTGTPSFLINQVKKHPQAVIPIEGITALKTTLSDISNLNRIHLGALMFQTGYLTIKEYNPEEKSYLLGFPNQEVKDAFFNSLIEDFTEIDPLEVGRATAEVRKTLETCDLEAFVRIMNSHFSKISHQLFSKAKEGFYQAVLFTFLEKSGVKTLSEIATNIGRIDLISEMPNAIYIFELKLDKTADVALTQVETKKYRKRFSESKKETLVIGINFSSKSRNIGDWKGIRYSASGDIIERFSP